MDVTSAVPGTPSLKERRPPMRSISLLPVLLIALLMVGCDVIRVDAPSSTEKAITDLYAAKTATQSEAAIRRFLVAAEIGSRWTESPLRHYELTNTEIRQLAEAQLAFNRGEEGREESAEIVYQAASRADEIRSEGQRWMRTPLRPIRASASEISLVLQALSRSDFEGFESSERTLAEAIVSRNGTLAQGQNDFSRETSLSPVQQFAYSVWLAHYGPTIFPFESDDEIPSAAKVLSSNHYMTGGKACDCLTSGQGGQLQWMVVRYQGDEPADVKVIRNNPFSGTFFEGTVNPGELFVVINSTGEGKGAVGPTIGNNVIFYLNGQVVTGPGSRDGKVHTSCSPGTVWPGETVGLGTGSPPNRIEPGAPFVVIAVESSKRQGQTCATDCLTGANARLEACLAVPGSKEAQCKAIYDADIDACHDQGLIDP